MRYAVQHEYLSFRYKTMTFIEFLKIGLCLNNHGRIRKDQIVTFKTFLKQFVPEPFPSLFWGDYNTANGAKTGSFCVYWQNA